MTVRPVPTRLAIAAAGLALATGLAACSSSGGETSSTTASPNASSPAVAASPSTVAAAFDRVATAAGDAKSVKGTLSTTTQVGAIDGDFQFEYTDAGLLASFSFDQAGKTVKGIITPQAIYIGGEALPLPSGKKFLKIGVTEDNPIAKSYRGLSESFTKAGDLEQAVAEWKNLGNLKAAGTETVDGVTATKYTGSIDPKNPPASASKAVKDGYTALAAAGVTSIETTIWVGPDGLPLKVTTTTVGGETASTSTITYEDWGSAVDVTVPAEADVTDFSKALGG